MNRHVLRVLGVPILATLVLLTMTSVAHAQEATLTGTVTDATGAVLPGVTITAIHEETGNTFVGFTDGAGVFRLPVRIGPYRITAELSGFATVTRTGLQMQVGQLATVMLQMMPSTVQETVTVTAEAPLIEVTTSTAAANIDQRQMQELPLNGRNWLDLTLLAPGSRANQGGETPIPRSQVAFQINMDGQQVTNSVAGQGFGQPRFSRDSIAEFEFIANRFDATQGRSMGVLVNAVTKSGTNRHAGTMSGYFRDSDWASKDPVVDRRIPFSNQQYSATYGGPIRRDRIHVFANYEYEREPQSAVYNSTLYPLFNVDLYGVRTQNTAGVKVDTQFTPQMRLSSRVNGYTQFVPLRGAGGATTHPSGASQWWRTSTQVWNQFTQVLSNNKVNEIKGGIYKYDWDITSLASWKGAPPPNFPGEYPIVSGHTTPSGSVLGGGRSATLGGSPRIQLSGYNIGTPTNLPQMIGQRTWQLRDDFTWTFDGLGRHDVRMGAEFLEHNFHFYWCSFCNGFLQANTGGAARRPTQAQLAAMLPDLFDWSTWNYNGLTPQSLVRFRQSVGDFHLLNDRHAIGAWYQDDWRLTQRLTFNLGLRWDADLGIMGEKKKLLPWMSGTRPHQLDWFQPRVGFAYSFNDRTVVRGGYGIYYTQLENDAAHQSNLNIQTIIPEVAYDGRGDFPMNPWGGAFPAFTQAQQQLCSSSLTPGCIRREISSEIPTTIHDDTYSHQTMVGVARQLGNDLAIEVSYQYTGQRREEVTFNQNLTYDPATGDNIPFSNIAARVYPEWGYVNGEYMQGWSNWHALVTSVTKRLSDRWQFSSNYTFGAVKDSTGPPCQTVRADAGAEVRCVPIPFQLRPDVAGEYTYASTDQRHRAVANGIWDVGRGFQLSGLYFYGSGMRNNVTCTACQARDTGTTGGTRRRDDGSIIERNSHVGTALHRVDLRLQQRVSLGGNRSIDGILELFNLFDYANYGMFTTDVSSVDYGRPEYNSNVAYAPRSVQLGFRLAF